jgi:hypothetical protein
MTKTSPIHNNCNVKLENLACNNWQTAYKSQIEKLPFREVAFPGAHDSLAANCNRIKAINLFGSFRPILSDHEMQVYRATHNIFQCFAKTVLNFFLKKVGGFGMAYSVNHTRTLSNQLKSGIRYFDLRFVLKPGGSSENPLDWHAFHSDVMFEYNLAQAIENFTDFLEENPDECLIFGTLFNPLNSCAPYRLLVDEIQKKLGRSANEIFIDKNKNPKSRYKEFVGSSQILLMGSFVEGNEPKNLNQDTTLRDILWPGYSCAQDVDAGSGSRDGEVYFQQAAKYYRGDVQMNQQKLIYHPISQGSSFMEMIQGHLGLVKENFLRSTLGIADNLFNPKAEQAFEQIESKIKNSGGLWSMDNPTDKMLKLLIHHNLNKAANLPSHNE